MNRFFLGALCVLAPVIGLPLLIWHLVARLCHGEAPRRVRTAAAGTLVAPHPLLRSHRGHPVDMSGTDWSDMAAYARGLDPVEYRSGRV